MRLVSLGLLVLVVVIWVNGFARPLSQESIPPDTLITLERTICYGTCPSYRLTGSASGAVTFEGREFVRVKGISRLNITDEKVRQLIALFDDAGYFSLKDRYESEKDGCPEVWTDNPSVVVSIRMNGKSKSISHYHGCQAGDGKSIYPKALAVLEDKIDKIVGTERWIK